jgi:hypothetical protein
MPHPIELSRLSLVLILALALLPAGIEALSSDRAAARATTSLKVFPSRARPGAKVRVRGRGFPARRRVALFLGQKRVRTLRTSRRGTFRVRFRVPRRRPRLYRLVARSRGLVIRLRFRLLRVQPAPKRRGDTSPSPPSSPSPAPAAPARAPTPGAPSTPTLVAAGDIACAPPGTQTASACHQSVTSSRVLALHPNAVALLGDDQYEHGELANFNAVYDPSWGRFKSLTHPAPGNHEYSDETQAPNHDSAPGYYSYFGAAAGDPTKGYYSYSLGSWRLFALNTGDLGFGGVADCFPVSCAAGQGQEQWLRAQLAALPASTCVLAYWHHPRYSSFLSRSHQEVGPLFDALYDNGAELALTGHVHNYERFAPMDASANLDNAYGLREFVVGTGGRALTGATGSAPNSQKLDLTHFGVLQLSLGEGRYDYRFVGEDGTVLDQGGAPCHRPHP